MNSDLYIKSLQRTVPKRGFLGEKSLFRTYKFRVSGMQKGKTFEIGMQCC